MKRILALVTAFSLLISGGAFSNTAYAADSASQTTQILESEAGLDTTEDTSSTDDNDTITASDATAKEVATTSSSIVKSNKELRGLWVPYCDFYSRGLSEKNRATYTRNVRSIVKLAKEYKCNVIFFHVRSHDDAVWKSSYFKASSYMVSGKKAFKKAAAAYSYDPLTIFINEAHAEGIELHAWMNPYRIDQQKYYDPSKKSSRDRVLKAVDEVLKYNVDGIHFDDYFYHAAKGYVTVANKSKIKKVNATAAQKRKYVNALVSAVYKKTHAKGKVFGISPQGNYENDMTSGADVKTWLSKRGYTDYVMPQIYWTDRYGRSGNITMFSDRLKIFSNLHKEKAVKLYIGLATYRCGVNSSDDIGWKKSNSNMVDQIKKLRKKGADGFCYFTLSSFYLGSAKKELKNLKKYLNKTVK